MIVFRDEELCIHLSALCYYLTVSHIHSHTPLHSLYKNKSSDHSTTQWQTNTQKYSTVEL
ncbi:hypothetical protein BpHYR1_011461 [Brachionus plicatilis]|uniref:Uncharacterized protein n=1 Tax=Brachionus plicatilis TaxID=10195 RepID=A0A3M7QFP8_BRAPC|nr:hypothetical protein BpHYR1_011461 [Brachionus plicatilis]